MRVLIYGFKPYAGYKSNISAEVLTAAVIHRDAAIRIFDVRFDEMMFRTAMKQADPDVILGLGQHPRARKLRLERRARNLMNDLEGDTAPIRLGGPAAITASLGLPNTGLTTRSYDAGNYVCNYSMYLAGEFCRDSRRRFGFIHIPREYDLELAGDYINKAIAGAISD